MAGVMKLQIKISESEFALLLKRADELQIPAEQKLVLEWEDYRKREAEHEAAVADDLRREAEEERPSSDGDSEGGGEESETE